MPYLLFYSFSALCRCSQLFQSIGIAQRDEAPSCFGETFCLKVTKHSGNDFSCAAEMARNLIVCDVQRVGLFHIAFLKQESGETGVKALAQHLVEQPHDLRQAGGHQFHSV